MINQVQNPNYKRWKFSLDGVVVEPGHTYTVSILNLPEPENGDYRIKEQFTIPGCGDRRIMKSLLCLQNGSLWDPHMETDVTFDKKNKKLYIAVSFVVAQYSENYQVSIQSQGFFYSKNISKENRSLISEKFVFSLWELSQCEMWLTIQPFFIQCKSDCLRVENTLNYCLYYSQRDSFVKVAVGLFLVGVFLASFAFRTSPKEPANTSLSADEEQQQDSKLQERKRVLIIYSPDHPLYKNIVLKLCAFLMSKCGTEVFLDLLDYTRLGVLGSIQWLEWHRQQIEKSSDKILILCSKGVQAKWKAMCGDKKVFLREDARSPVGDMLSPALSLLIPHFIRSASYEKYIVAYFEDISSEEDVPSPFRIMIRYKLMKQFEEVLFRILDAEKHKPGRVNYIEGISEGEHHNCPSGRDLQDAVDAFQAYQLQHPHWFEDELLESSELEVEESSAEICEDAQTTTALITSYDSDSTKVFSLLNSQERPELSKNEECQLRSDLRAV
ncbi:interleukin-17 receptor A isoform X2 [Cheilinus undulatus]|nr:interleukin-17 receptor A isoform X2 [Cheilinus undulatus]